VPDSGSSPTTNAMRAAVPTTRSKRPTARAASSPMAACCRSPTQEHVTEGWTAASHPMLRHKMQVPTRVSCPTQGPRSATTARPAPAKEVRTLESAHRGSKPARAGRGGRAQNELVQRPSFATASTTTATPSSMGRRPPRVAATLPERRPLPAPRARASSAPARRGFSTVMPPSQTDVKRSLAPSLLVVVAVMCAVGLAAVVRVLMRFLWLQATTTRVLCSAAVARRAGGPTSTAKSARGSRTGVAIESQFR